MHNGNEAIAGNVGSSRSTAASGLSGKGTLGALRCRTSEGIEFNIGTGFTAAQRVEFWGQQRELLGTSVKFKSFQHGVKDAPRHPVFLGFRHKDDMS
jgi:DNA ligase-1